MNLGTDSTDARRADVSEETKYLRNIAVGVEEVHGPAGIGVLAVKLASLALTSDFDGFCDLIDNSGDQVAGNLGNEAFVKLLVSGINVGIDQHSGRCAQALGTWFYNGYVVPQSYEGAEHCYALADKWGNSQGTVNLGYIYYYGRTGERDYARAFQLFSKAVATDDNPEGLWKLGDMWHKGLFVEKDEVAAFSCYRRARDLCKSDATLGARAAHHMADMLLSGVRDADGVLVIGPNAMMALALYGEAELGYYDLIDNQGLAYYEGALKQAIAGQARARAVVAAERQGLGRAGFGEDGE